jgi:hypothetical protein
MQSDDPPVPRAPAVSLTVALAAGTLPSNAHVVSAKPNFHQRRTRGFACMADNI